MSTDVTKVSQKQLSENIARQAAWYSLAAAAAGVTALAMVQPSAAEIVVTKKTIPIPVETNGKSEPVEISIANNGVHNFSVQLLGSSISPGRTLLVSGVNIKNDEIIMGGDWDPYAKALGQGVKIGPANSSFFYTGLVELSASSGANKYCKGYWGSNLKNLFIGCGNPKDKYLGISFLLNGKTHSGWIRLNVKTTSNPSGPALTASITEYVYETVANKAISAGATSGPVATAGDVQAPEDIQSSGRPSLGLLAAGADGLPLWRREKASPLK